MQTTAQPRPTIDELVINWHVTEACNYQCRFCYAKWSRPDRKEIWRDEARSLQLLDRLADFFRPGNPENCLSSHLTWGSLRLSLAGGEPTLLGHGLERIVRRAAERGMRVSLITNGSRPALIDRVVPDLDLLGMSVDSLSPQTNAVIGRADRAGHQISADDIRTILSSARRKKPGIRIKVNTVVNAANQDEDFRNLLRDIRPHRWKVLRMLPVQNEALRIDDDEFRAFVDRHTDLAEMMSVEDNADMEHSYIMVDPHGRFFQNGGAARGYSYSSSILNAGVQQAFGEILICVDRLVDRYASSYQAAHS